MKLLNKNRGFITIAALFIVGSTLLIGVNGLKTQQKERNNFYGSYISAAKEKELLQQNTFYFDFNSYALQEQYKLPLYAHARKLIKSPKSKVYINGHTDNKGTINYNFKLGLLRAKSVAEVLSSKGVILNNMVIISYADQLPDLSNNQESVSSNQSNRRVQITYTKQDRNY